MEHLDDAAVGKNLVKNFKGENACNEVTYKELTALFPDIGCPLLQYETVDTGYKTALLSDQAVQQIADKMAHHAKTEFASKRHCIEGERKT
jgi:hypothetical protein